MLDFKVSYGSVQTDSGMEHYEPSSDVNNLVLWYTPSVASVAGDVCSTSKYSKYSPGGLVSSASTNEEGCQSKTVFPQIHLVISAWNTIRLF